MLVFLCLPFIDLSFLILSVLYRTLLIITILSSCSIVNKPLALKRESIEYAEALFKRQNQATMQVMMLFEEELTLTEEVELSNAELQMHDKCHLLNEMANHEIAGEEVSVYFKGQVQRSFKACDEYVKDMESMLKQIGKMN